MVDGLVLVLSIVAIKMKLRVQYRCSIFGYEFSPTNPPSILSNFNKWPLTLAGLLKIFSLSIRLLSRAFDFVDLDSVKSTVKPLKVFYFKNKLTE